MHIDLVVTQSEGEVGTVGHGCDPGASGPIGEHGDPFFALRERMGEVEPPRLTLREIADEMLFIDQVLAATDGELTPEMEARLDAACDALAGKADGIVSYLKGLEADAKVQKTEEQRLADFRKQLEKRHKRLKDYVALQLQRMGRPKVEGEFSKLAVQTNPPSLEILDEDQVPDEFKETELVTRINNAALKDALLAQERAITALCKQYKVETYDAALRIIFDDLGFGVVDDDTVGDPRALLQSPDELPERADALRKLGYDVPALPPHIPGARITRGTSLRIT